MCAGRQEEHEYEFVHAAAAAAAAAEEGIHPSFSQNVAIHGDADEPPFPCIPLMQGGKRPWVKISRTRWCRE